MTLPERLGKLNQEVQQLSQNNWQELEQKLFLRTGNRVPVTLVRGQGALVWDDQGREYLDFVGGWAVNSLGHCPPVVVEALEKQAKTLIQASNQFYTIPQIELAQLLISHSCLDRVFFCNSGAEANEGQQNWLADMENFDSTVLTRSLLPIILFMGGLWL